MGADQRQHVEFAREIAKRANNLLKGRHFTLPQMICTAGGCTKVMALDDGRRKMSKSDSSSPNAVLFLLDDAEVVKRKITASITDSCNRVAYDEQRQPALANLLRLYAFWEGISVSAICAKYEGVTNYRFLKQDLVNVVNGGLEPIRQAYRSISADDAKKHDIEEALCANEKKLQQECSLFLRDIQTEAKC